MLGVLGPAFAQETLGLEAEDFAVVVLPLGFGIVTGILLLNSYGRYFHRRRVIEGGLIALGILLAALSAAGPISRLLQRADAAGRPRPVGRDVAAGGRRRHRVLRRASPTASSPSRRRPQLQEDLPEDVRGRVFGVLGMLVSVASFLPIIIVGPISDLVGTTAVIFVVAIAVMVVGIVSVLTRGPLRRPMPSLAADPHAVDPIAAALGADLPTWTGHPTTEPRRRPGPARSTRTPRTAGRGAGRAGRAGRDAASRPDRPD